MTDNQEKEPGEGSFSPGHGDDATSKAPATRPDSRGNRENWKGRNSAAYSGNFEPPSHDVRVRKRAEYMARKGTGSIDDWEQYAEEAESQVSWEGFEKWLADQGWLFSQSYAYHNPGGQPLYEALRFIYALLPTKKKFILRHRVNDQWIRGAGPVRVPYNLPDLLKQPDAEITLLEGEKGADLLYNKGILATCIQGQNWTDDAAQFFAGRTVNIAMDNDDAGHEHIETAVDWLHKYGARVRVLDLPDLKPRQGADDWLQTHSLDEWQAVVNETKPEASINTLAIEPYDFPPEETLPPYDWLYGSHLLRGEVAGTAATGGTGKSSLSIVEALAMASGKQLLHNAVPTKACVLLINLEDSRDTMRKRIAAAMKHHRLTAADIGDRLIVLGKGDIKIRIASQVRGVVERDDGAVRTLIKLAKKRRVDTLSIDSFIRAHSVNENDNNAIQQVIECFEDVARKANNGRSEFEDDADSVGVVTCWNYPKLAEIDTPAIERALEAIRAGGVWRENSQSKKEPWVGEPIARAIPLNLKDKRAQKKVRQLIKELLVEGKLRQVERQDEHRQKRKYIEAAAVKPVRRD